MRNLEKIRLDNVDNQVDKTIRSTQNEPIMIHPRESSSAMRVILAVLLSFSVSAANGFSLSISENREIGSQNLIKNEIDRAWDLDKTNKTVQDVEPREERALIASPKTFFGQRRRLAFALLPIMFKLGVIVTLLIGITVMVVKGLSIGVFMLFVAFSHFFKKISGYHHSNQPVHLHVHSGSLHPKPPVYTSYEEPGPWDKSFEETAPLPGYETYDPTVNRISSYRHPYRFSVPHYYGYQ